MTSARPAMDRRNFLRGGFLSARRSDAALAHPLPLHRPPHAAPETAFLRACDRCMKCAEACPHNAIRSAGPRFRDAAGTPMIAPQLDPCRLCEDMPCVSACPTGALSPSFCLGMGTARVQAERCLPFCSVCAERCPVPGAMRLSAGGVTVDDAACVGCGVCVYVCPAPDKPVMIFAKR